MKKISISTGNKKMGAIPSVSLPACVTCNPKAPCFHDCYARRMSAYRSNVRQAYENNLELWKADPGAYFEGIREYIEKTHCKNFRFHVSGDIPSVEYAIDMFTLAHDFPETRFLCFTKQYEIVNKAVELWGADYEIFPENLQILFSLWDDEWNATIINPYNFPYARVIWKGTPENEYPEKTCGGNCTECYERGAGCWTLKHGETIGLFQH